MDQLQKDAVASIASVSTLLRNAIGAALPVAPEQYLTIAIPGTVIDTANYDQGGSFVYDASKHATPPTTVRQNEARLVDGMMPIAKIMLGNTGKSVARSYSRALDGLLPAKADITSGTGIRSSGSKSYKDAMTFLRKQVDGTKTIVDVYCEKQRAWGEARAKWDQGKIDAQAEAEKLFPQGSSADYIGKQKQFFNDWNQEHFYAFKASNQAAWMDWVVNGQKYDVDFNFGMIDIDSIMQRVEASKESLRNSTIPDSDGASEVYGVSLTPAPWATYCQRKAAGWYDRNGHFTLGQLDAEIARLHNLLSSYTIAQTTMDQPTRTYPVASADVADPSILPAGTDSPETKLSKAMSALYTSQGKLSATVYNASHAKPEDHDKATKAVDEARDALKVQEQAVQDAHAANEQAKADKAEYNRITMQGDAVDSTKTWIQKKIDAIKAELVLLDTARKAKVGTAPATIPIITGATVVPPTPATPSGGAATTVDANITQGVELASEGDEIASPIFKIPSGPATATIADTAAAAADADPWTTITLAYSASDLKTHSQESSWGMKVGGSVGFGLWSFGGSYSHDESHSSMQSDFAACDVSISFSALVVNINRPWLYGELFSDIELELADGVKLSPGPLALKKMMDDQKIEDIAMYSQFPAYPTSFIVAADTTIEFTGSTKHIEQAFNSHSNSGGASVGWGPFSVSSSFHESASDQSMQVHSTATGCKLLFGAPQVIGWISQILPALPRPVNYNPLTQGAGIPVSG